MPKLSPNFGHVPIECWTAWGSHKTPLLCSHQEVYVPCKLHPTRHIIHHPQIGQIHVQLWHETLQGCQTPPPISPRDTKSRAHVQKLTGPLPTIQGIRQLRLGNVKRLQEHIQFPYRVRWQYHSLEFQATSHHGIIILWSRIHSMLTLCMANPLAMVTIYRTGLSLATRHPAILWQPGNHSMHTWPSVTLVHEAHQHQSSLH